LLNLRKSISDSFIFERNHFSFAFLRRSSLIEASFTIKFGSWHRPYNHWLCVCLELHIHIHMIYDWRIRSVFDISRVEWKVFNILATRLWPSPPQSCIYFTSDTRLFWHLTFVSSEPTSANWLTKYWQFVKLC